MRFADVIHLEAVRFLAGASEGELVRDSLGHVPESELERARPIVRDLAAKLYLANRAKARADLAKGAALALGGAAGTPVAIVLLQQIEPLQIVVGLVGVILMFWGIARARRGIGLMMALRPRPIEIVAAFEDIEREEANRAA